MSYNQLIILCAAQAIAAIIGILWGVKRIHDMEKAAREMARGMTQLNTWDVDARIERLEGFREMVFRMNTKLGELENRLSDHIKVFDGHVLDTMSKNIFGRIGQLELDMPHLQKQLDDRISGAYKAAQEAHVAAASVGSELEKVRRSWTVSPRGEDKALWSRMTEVLDRLNDIEKGSEAFATKGEVQKMATELSYSIADGMEKEGKALWAHITQLHQDVSNLQQQMRQPSATQAPLKPSRPIDDLAKEMLKQQQDQYIVVPADMGPTIEKMFSGPEVTEAIGKELGWSSPESEMNLRIAFLEKLVKNDVENLCQLEKKVNDICKNTRHKADEDTLFGHFDARIKGLSKRVTNIEGQLPHGDESHDPDRETPFDCISRRIDRAIDRIQKLEVKRQEDDNTLNRLYKQLDAIGERVRNIEKRSEKRSSSDLDIMKGLNQIKEQAEILRANEVLSQVGQGRITHLITLTNALTNKVGGSL